MVVGGWFLLLGKLQRGRIVNFWHCSLRRPYGFDKDDEPEASGSGTTARAFLSAN